MDHINRDIKFEKLYWMASCYWNGINADVKQGPVLLTWFNFNPSMDK